MHAITLLAQDRTTRETWFWNGFGMAVVDAIRPAAPLQPTPHTSLQIRPARLDDAEALYALDIEHCQHYSQAPVFMTPRTPASASEWREFLSQEHHSAWLAVDGSQAAGFIRFEPDSEGACAIVASQGTIAITGAYVRPLVRGRQAAPAILDAALHHYAAQGFTRCAVDFESFNPEAATFWLKYFKPVCYSLTRVPEDALG
jgi:GNAT superfamily N-acetyltransferase